MTHSQSLRISIDDLPDEVLEFIIGFLPPYKDLQDCLFVSKRWYICCKSVMRKTTNSLHRAIADFNIRWRNITPVDMAPSITKRFSHAACVHENSMYIFGGCTTNSTSFNDLWRFDLSKRQWIRPLTMGAYPTPKAYASMICYKDSLILFGGWTYPSPSQYYQDWTMFSEIHFYSVTNNRWILMNATNNPPPMAGHSAFIRDDTMVVFGGLYKPTIQSCILCSNDVWILDLKTMIWTKQPTAEPRPSPRYSQSLILLNKNNIMILGGVQALYNRCVYNDCWVLRMEGPVWTWYELTVKNKEWSAANIWCNPAIKVGDKVVSLGRCQNGASHPVTSAVRIASADRAVIAPLSSRVEQNVRRPLNKDLNINGRRGCLAHRRPVADAPEINHNVPGPSNVNIDTTCRLRVSNDNNAPGGSTADVNVKNGDKNKLETATLAPDNENSSKENSISIRNQILPNRRVNPSGGHGNRLLRRLIETDKFRMAAFACDTPVQHPPRDAELLNQRRIINFDPRPEAAREIVNQAPTPVVKKLRRNTLAIHVLDISSVLNENTYSSVSWMCPRDGEVNGAPEEFIMYSLVRGKGELIMFGGVHNDVNLVNNYTSSPQYSNSLHFITPPRDII